MAAVCFCTACQPAKRGRNQCAGDSRAGACWCWAPDAGTHVTAAALSHRAAILQMLPPKGIPASSARKPSITEMVNQERWSEGKAGEWYAPCAEVLSLMRDINK